MEHDLLMNPAENGAGQKHTESRESQQDDPIDFEEVMDEFGEFSGKDD